MELTLGGGAVVDLATLDDVKAMQTASAEQIKHNRPPLPAQPIRTRRTFDAPGASPATISLGKPSSGRAWNLLYLVVTGIDDHTVVAGSSAAVYKGDDANPSLSQLITPGNTTSGTTLPVAYDYTERVVWINDSESLYVVVYGAGAQAQVTVTATIDDWAWDAVSPGRL